MNDVGTNVRKISLLAALLGALALVVPVAAGAQALDPVLEQYAPSTQQINNKVKGDKPDQSDGGGSGGSSDAEGGEGGAVAGTGSDDDAGLSGGSGSAGGSESAGGGAGAGGAHNGSENSSAAAETGLDARVLSGLPITRLDFLVIALALGALVVAAVMLRRLTRSFEVGS